MKLQHRLLTNPKHRQSHLSARFDQANGCLFASQRSQESESEWTCDVIYWMIPKCLFVSSYSPAWMCKVYECFSYSLGGQVRKVLKCVHLTRWTWMELWYYGWCTSTIQLKPEHEELGRKEPSTFHLYFKHFGVLAFNLLLHTSWCFLLACQ